uniref:Uncharacterized protein n=1 Tax=Populus trichocarpa TaxID=3694 RepID=U5GSI2_POPTR
MHALIFPQNAGMMTILDDFKVRIQKSLSGKKKVAQLRRCNTDLRPSLAPADQKPDESASDGKERKREIMAAELARKVHELNETEELVYDLKSQNETLMAKLQACFVEKKSSSSRGEAQGN